jgi:polyhydroxyalkanoate synthase
MIRQPLGRADTMLPLTTSLKPEVPRLPCPAHAPGYGKGRGAAVPGPRAQLGSKTPPAPPPEPYPADGAFHAVLARLAGGISPIALSLAYIDWASHLAGAPQRQAEIARDGLRSAAQFYETALHYFSSGGKPWSQIKPQPQDRRFANEQWENPPFNLFAQAFLLNEQWWHNATTGVCGVAPANEAVVEFSVRQLLDMLVPSNSVATYPEVLQKAAFRSGGENVVFGWQNLCDDVMRLMSSGRQ